MSKLQRILCYCFVAALFFASVFLLFLQTAPSRLAFSETAALRTQTKTADISLRPLRQIYVCGAVENEGYYYFREGDTYIKIASQAGLLDNSYLDNFSLVPLEIYATVIYVGFIELDGSAKNSYNFDSPLFFSLAAADRFFPQQALQILNDYTSRGGRITNKAALLELLGQNLYDSTHFRIYFEKK